MNTIESGIVALIAATLRVDPARVARDASLTDDLGADSLDSVTLLIAIEDRFGVDIPDEEAEQIRTVKEMIEYVTFAAAMGEVGRTGRAGTAASDGLRVR